MSRSRTSRLRILAVLAALVVAALSGLGPAHAAPPDDLPAVVKAGQQARDLTPAGWNWRSTESDDDGGFTTQGWNWR